MNIDEMESKRAANLILIFGRETCVHCVLLMNDMNGAYYKHVICYRPTNDVHFAMSIQGMYYINALR